MIKMKDTIRTIDKRTAALISLCFLLTSIGYLSWTYHMLDLIPSKMAELLTLSAGYLMQAAGIGLFRMSSTEDSADWTAYS